MNTRIPLELLKVNGLYHGYRDVPNPYRPGRIDESLLAVYKGDGEYWTLEYDMLPDGKKDYAKGRQVRTRKDVSVDPEGVRPVEEKGVVAWNDENELKEWLNDYYAEPRIERGMLVRFEMDPRWLTSTVIDLCRDMRNEDDYSRLPLLADALMDAGCDGEALIAACRAEKNAVYAQRIVALVLGGELAEAVKWLESFGDKWNFAYIDMIKEPQMPDSGLVAGGIDLHGAGELDPGDQDRYWECVELLVGKKLRPDESRDFYWSCSC